ncbi:MAG TPA: hypothetical protein VGY56_01520 [Verrucomicrobiae bacterium]|nr:hypothetical protein [Verrucomicrobiae bacterium]
MPVSSGALRDGYFATGGAAAAKVQSRQHGMGRQRFCRWSWLSLAGVKETEKSEQLPEDFSAFKVKVRIHYLKMRFIWGFTMILPVQCCAVHAQCNRKFLSYSSIAHEK